MINRFDSVITIDDPSEFDAGEVERERCSGVGDGGGEDGDVEVVDEGIAVNREGGGGGGMGGLCGVGSSGGGAGRSVAVQSVRSSGSSGVSGGRGAGRGFPRFV